MDKTEYKFPDEVNEKELPVDQEQEIEIEIVDDTPEEDRRNSTPMPQEIVDELDNDDLEAYSGDAKQKLLQLKKVWNDERRAKEAALREQQEALRVAQQLVDENKKLKGKLSTGEQTLVNNYKENVARELEDAKRAYKDAYDSGDSELLAEAQDRLFDVKMKAQEIEKYKPEFSPEALQSQENDVQIQHQPKLEPKTQAWLDKNSWYGSDEDMSYLAMGIHRRLEKEGVALGSDHYFSVIDKEMRQRFPEKFSGTQEPEQEIKTSTKSSAPRTVVAPATRSTSPKKITLTPTQVQLAKKFNLTPEQYARELTKLESQNG
jgi:hypothetical protein